MDGFKNTTKMKYMGAGGMVDGYSMGGYAKGGNAKPMMKGGDAKPMMAKGGNAKAGAKISKVMGEFKKGDLHSGSKDGPKVKSPKQAMAIALSEAGKGKMPMKKGGGGDVKVGKMPPLGESVKSGNRVSKMTAAEMREMEERFGNKRRPSPGDSVKSGNRIAKEEADEARHLGVFKKGGKVRKYAEGGPVEPAMKRSMPMMTELPVGVGAAPPMKVPTTRPDPNVIQPTIVTADGRVPNPAYTADVAMQRYRTQLPNDNYYSPQELQQIMSSIENAYSQPGATGQQVGSAYQNASAAATRARAAAPPPSDYVGLIDNRIGPDFGKPMQPMQPTAPRAGMLGGLLGALNNPRMKQALQQKMMQPQAPRRGLLGALNNPRIREDLQQAMMQPQAPMGMAPVEPRNVTMMRHGGRAAMPKRGR